MKIKDHEVVAVVFVVVAWAFASLMDGPFNENRSITIPAFGSFGFQGLAVLAYNWPIVANWIDDVWHNATKPINPQRTKVGPPGWSSLAR